MVSYPQLASLATYKFDSAIFRLNLSNSLYNLVFIFRTWRVRIRIFFFFFFFFLRVAEEFSEVARSRATRVFYTGEIIGWSWKRVKREAGRESAGLTHTHSHALPGSPGRVF